MTKISKTMPLFSTVRLSLQLNTCAMIDHLEWPWTFVTPQL